VALQKDNEELAARSTQISKWSEIKAVAFDAFPVFDSRPILRACAEAFPGRGSNVNNTAILPGGVTA
jgi:hypothetical protein